MLNVEVEQIAGRLAFIRVTDENGVIAEGYLIDDQDRNMTTASLQLDKVHRLMHRLIVSPDFRIAGGLVKVSSLEEALDG